MNSVNNNNKNLKRDYSKEEIEEFLYGKSDEKYIVNIKFDYYTDTIIKFYEDPIKGKYKVEDKNFIGFLWAKYNIREKLYKGDLKKIKESQKRHGIVIKQLETGGHPRYEDGYKFLITSTKSHKDLKDFLFYGGVKTYKNDSIIYLNEVEQYMIINGIRLFKGFDNYSDVHRATFDIETTSLSSKNGRMFLIGLKDNRGYSKIIRTNLNDEGECDATLEFFNEVANMCPSILSGYNSFNFDFPFIDDRFQRSSGGLDLKTDLSEILKEVNKDKNFRKDRFDDYNLGIKKDCSIKIGSEVFNYDKYLIPNTTTIDIIHAVKRAAAINSDIKEENLKYISKFSRVAKPNRVYIKGENIYELWDDKRQYHWSETNGEYFLSTELENVINDYSNKNIDYVNFCSYDRFNDDDNSDNDIKYEINLEDKYSNFNNIGKKYEDVKKLRSSIKDIISYAKENELEYPIEDNKKLNRNIAILYNIFKIDTDSFNNYESIYLLSNNKAHIDIYNKWTNKLNLTSNKPIFIVNGEEVLTKVNKEHKNVLILNFYNDCSLGQTFFDYNYPIFTETSGEKIVEKYLIDDLQETLDVDNIYSQTSFLLSSFLPTTFENIYTMGTGAYWKLLMMNWSYLNNLAIPKVEEIRDFVGGISKIYSCGFNKYVIKVDFNSLYPSIQLTYDLFPSTDITNIIKSLLEFFFDTRNFFKSEMGRYEALGDKTKALFYESRQLPIKIFNNSNFGSISAPKAFHWSDIDVGEAITCTARQFLRLAMKFFISKGFKPITIDTDGCDLSLPEDHEKYQYICKGKYGKLKEGEIIKGFKAYIAEFNEKFMVGRMGLGFDGEWISSINLARKNYIKKDYKGKIKYTGATFKNKLLHKYKVEFSDKAIPMLLDGDGFGFVEYYYQYLTKMLNKEIPLRMIASQNKIKHTKEEYISRLKKKNKNGKPLNKLCHMELALESGLDFKVGDVIAYVNNGDKANSKNLGNSYMINAKDLNNNPNLTGDYNVKFYVRGFNKFLKPLLVCFKPEVRNKILIEDLSKRIYFTKEELSLINGIPLQESKQDKLDDLFIPDIREVKFWDDNYGYNPDIFQDDIDNFFIPLTLDKKYSK